METLPLILIIIASVSAYQEWLFSGIVHGPESEIIPPVGIFVDPYIFVVWTLVFKNLVVGCKIDAG